MSKLLSLILATISLSAFGSSKLIEPGFKGRLPIPKEVFGIYKREQILNAKNQEHRVIGQVGNHCSGTLIGKKHVLTAAHCVYDQAKKEWKNDLSFHPGRVKSEESPFGQFNWSKVFLQKEYTEGLKDYTYDFAVIELKEDAGELLGWRGFRAINTDEEFNDRVTITGYPGDKEAGTMWKVNCPATYESDFVFHKCDTFGGMSGSAFISQRREDTIPYITGVHAAGGETINGGPIMNKKNFNLIRSWVKETQYSANTYVYKKPTPTFDKIFIRNNCHRKIEVALSWKNLNSEWVTDGFWHLKPGEERHIASTKNTVYYTWAQSTDGQVEWTGTHNMNLRQYTLPMRERKITSKEWGEWIETFSCSR